jgi:chemotaxis regulatin CheY-phosphate phosphatase CheZ
MSGMDSIAPASPPDKTLRAALRAELEPLLAELRSFVDRRIAELSAEVHASVELADLGETRIAGDIARMQDQIAQLVAAPAAATRNSGLELEAVVQVTEDAANTIMEAAEAIGDWIAAGRDAAGAPAIVERVHAIFEACAFQDLTGQRIRRAIQHLQQVEGTLTALLPGLDVPDRPRVTVPTLMRTVESPKGAPDLAQAEIDALLNG